MFKIRASAAETIMKSDRSGKGMGETAKTYVEQWVKEQIYSRRKTIDSKYFDKGIETEQGSIDMVAEYFGYPLLVKNEQNFTNDFATGTPDVLAPGHIIEIKNSWDCFTFPLFDEVPDKKYEWQCQVYMWLTGIHEARLTYVLSDTPEHIIEAEGWKYCRQNGIPELDIDIMEKIRELHTYEKIPTKHRIKQYILRYDDVMINQLCERVELCRAHVDKIMSKL